MIRPSHALSPDDARDEVLEAIWTAEELDDNLRTSELAHLLGDQPATWRRAVSELSAAGHLVEHEGRPKLTASGRELARVLIRRHRLTEVLYTRLVGLEIDAADRAACRTEHALDDDATDAICTFLGHPKRCPHGRELPPGPCCIANTPPTLRRLTDLDSGCHARIALLLPDDASTLTQLSDLGLVPGCQLTVRQRHPSLVVAVDQTVVALDGQTAERVLVRENG